MNNELTQQDIMKIAPYLDGVVSMDVKLLKRKGFNIKQVILEYKNGSKKIADINSPNPIFVPYKKLTSVQEYVARGNDGQWNYPGNCCGMIIEQFIDYVADKVGGLKNIFFADPMYGGGTSIDVAKRKGISFWADDLKNGFDFLSDLMPKGPNALWIHPPYFVGMKNNGTLTKMPQYSGVAWGAKENICLNDGSHLHKWNDYIKWLNTLVARGYQQLAKGGYMGILNAAAKVDGVYLDPLIDMDKYGDIESVIIKKQTNCMSDNTNYSDESFIPIVHEYLIILKKKDSLIIPCRVIKHVSVNIMQSAKITWKSLVTSVIEHLGGKATLDQLVEMLKNHPKAETNNHLREKLRQVVNTFKDEFEKFNDSYQLTPRGKKLAESVMVAV